MNNLVYLIVHTSNLLGIFNDPFEFDGDYGPEVNPVRQKVFELVVSQESLARNLPDSQILTLTKEESSNSQEIKEFRKTLVDQAIDKDRNHGPTLAELVTPELMREIVKKQKTLQSSGFTEDDLDAMLHFVTRFGNQKVFRFLKNPPSKLVALDKILKDQAARQGRDFDLPILGSVKALKGRNTFELNKELFDSLFTEETFLLTKPQEELKKTIIHAKHVEDFLGDQASPDDLQVFCSRAGQTFFYWLYQAMNLHLVSQDQNLIEKINEVKRIFTETIGNLEVRAPAFIDKLTAANSGVLFTQECDGFIRQALVQEGRFYPIEKQNPHDGCFVFLRSDLWKPNYEVILIENYPDIQEGRINAVLAEHQTTGEKFLLASCHGHSTNSADGRLQISQIKEKFDQLSQTNSGLQLIIGIDANTKTEEDVQLLREHLDALGLMATESGPTTIKRRMATVQNTKAGKFSIDEEDYLIVLKPGNGGRYALSQPTISFKEEKPDLNCLLPNADHPFDHFPVGAGLLPLN